jgi:glycosyltransferase involved in cell wall biosynthesis
MIDGSLARIGHLMRVLVHEQEYAGHHFQYLAHLLPRLVDQVDEVVVTITPMAHESVEFRTLLAPLADRVDFQPTLPHGDPSLKLKGRVRLLRILRDAVRRVRPDYVLVPSGDGPSSAMGLFRAAGLGGLPGDVPAEVGIHYGYGPVRVGIKNRLKDLLYTQSQWASSWKRIHYVSPVVYEGVTGSGGSLARRAALLPHPVPAVPRLDKRECRRRLGIPEEGRYLGLAGVLDVRKGLDRLLAAFRTAAGPDDRLLLAGRMDPWFSRSVEDEYADLIRQDRLIRIDRYLDAETFDLVPCALDVACTTYPKFGQLSSVMLHGLAAGRPVLANDFGWMRVMVRRFGCGWACDVLDPSAFAATIRTALDGASAYHESEATRRLLQFHAPANFAGSWLAGIREAQGLPPSEGLRSWSWVLEALDEDRRALR